MAAKKDGKTGKWFFYGKHKDGKQYKRRGFETKKEALTAELKFLEEYENKEEGEFIKFEQLANEYLSWYEKRRKKSSYTKIESIVRVHLVPEYGEDLITEIRPRDIIRYQDSIINNYAPSHVKKIHTTLSAVFKFGIKQEYITQNPASIVGNVELEEVKHVNFWTLEEFKAFIKHVEDPLYYALFMTLYYSGMRKGELLALTWGDIDTENNIINVNKTEYNRTITTPKTKASIRKILMPQFVMSLLTKLKARVKPQMTYVVFGEFNTSISTSTLDKWYDHYISLSGVKRIRLHDFRHSHASYLINKGYVISMIASRLGQGDVAMLLNTYGHLYPSTEKEAVDDMEHDFKPVQVIQFQSK